MANVVKNTTAKVKSNIVGSIAGGAIGWWASAKYLGVTGTWTRIGVTVLGVIAGAYVQSAIAAKGSAPKGTDVKK